MKAFHEVRNYIADFMVWHECYSNINFVAHWHREIEFIYVREGTAEIHVTDYTYSASKGDLIICDSGDIHFCNTHSDNSILDFLIFDTSMISSHYKYSYFANQHFSSKSLDASGLSTVWNELLNVLDYELGKRELYYQDIVKASLRNFWFHLLRTYPEQSNRSIKQNRRSRMLSDFQQVLTFLEEHYEDNITLEDASEMMGFSSSHFSRMFKQLTGTGFVHYLNIIRISKAAEMLKDSDKKITEISFLCGFSSVRSFNRVFLEITGYTPSEYVKQPESKSYDFTYYRSSADLFTIPEKNPTII